MVSLRRKRGGEHAEEMQGKEKTDTPFFSRFGKLITRSPAAALKKCRRCGTKNPEEVLYCKECGLRYPVHDNMANGGVKPVRDGPADVQENGMHQKKTLLEKGNAFYKSGHYQEALEMYDRALALDREYAKAWNNRSLALSKLGREQEASDSRNHFLALQGSVQNPGAPAPRTR